MWSAGLTSTGIQPMWMGVDKRHYHSSFNVLGGITIPECSITTKKFQNPNFVNKQNPFVHSKYSSSQVLEDSVRPLGDEIKIEEPKTINMGCTKKRSRKNRRRNKTTKKKMGGDENTQKQSSPVNIIQVYKRSVAFTISPPKNYCHERQPSICESEDSLVIVFEDDDNDDDCDKNNEDTTSLLSESSDQEIEINSDEDVNSVGIKKVRFADRDSLCVVHPMVQWSFAYQAARKGPWEEYARDRERFKLRISNIESVLLPILQKEHRDAIYKQRFEED